MGKPAAKKPIADFLVTNLINPLKQENRLTTSLMLIREITAIYCENRKQHINTLYGQRTENFSFKEESIYC